MIRVFRFRGEVRSEPNEKLSHQWNAWVSRATLSDFCGTVSLIER